MPFLWRSREQPAARWHGPGDGPANYFADTPTGAWAEFLRHEEITDPADLAGVRRSLWAVELPELQPSQPQLPPELLLGGVGTYPPCQQEARRLRAAGARSLEAPSAALRPGAASGWHATDTGIEPAGPVRDGLVWVVFGPCEARGWLAVQGGAPPAATLALVRPLATQE